VTVVCAARRLDIGVTIRVDATAATAVVLVVTELVLVRWKPSARSRSLSGISALGHPHRAALARIGPAQATILASLARARLALPVRQEEIC